MHEYRQVYFCLHLRGDLVSDIPVATHEWDAVTVTRVTRVCAGNQPSHILSYFFYSVKSFFETDTLILLTVYHMHHPELVAVLFPISNRPLTDIPPHYRAF